MKKLLLATCFIAAITVPALAQEQYTVKVTGEDINLIGKALGKLPFEEVSPLIQKLRVQIAEQQQQKDVPPPKPVVPQEDKK